jgi:hypothetical protein
MRKTCYVNWLLLFPLVFSLIAPPLAWAHEDADNETLEATLSLYRQIAELSPLVAPSEPATRDASSAFILIGGQRIQFNGTFWQLVRGWLRVYHKELKSECRECLNWDEADFSREAEDQVAKGFLATKLVDPLLEGAEHISVGAADVGARLGKTALVAKIAGEVGETILSKMSFMGGMHFVCHLIDAFILFGTRRMQTAYRSFAWANVFDRSGVTNSVQMGLISSSVARAQRRVRFVAAPGEIDPEILQEVDREGSNRFWGWVKDGKRAAWVKRLATREDRTLTLRRREALGRRMKRYVWLKARKRGHSQFIKGKTPMDKTLNSGGLWVLAVQENVLQRPLLPKEDEVPQTPDSLADSYAAAHDEIRQGLAREFAAGDREKIRFVDGLLKDMDVIFNPEVSARVRYFQATALENLLSGFIYGTFSRVLDQKGELFGNSPAGIWRQIRLRWKTGRVGGYIYELSDFLRLASQQRDPARLMKHKYEAMESLLRLLTYFNKAKALADAETTDQLRTVQDLLAGEYSKLRTFKPWREKRIARSWLPWRRPLPLCRQMDKAVNP